MVESAQERLERAEPRELVEEVLYHLLPLALVELHARGGQQRPHDAAQLLPEALR